MAEQQVYSDQSLAFGGYAKFFWPWAADNSVVPPKKVLGITAITLDYFPSGGETVGRADITGRDSNNNAVWRLQIVYAEPKKTVHLPFPKALTLEEGGHVEAGFVDDGPGELFISLNGTLADK